MVTGIEIGSLVLAIAPLVITALEHHRALVEPIKASLRFRKRALKAYQGFGIASTLLSQALELIARDCGFTASQYASIVKGPTGGVDEDSGANAIARERLEELFGSDAYYFGIRPLLTRIFEILHSIGNDLGLELGSGTTDTQILWASIEKARARLNLPISERFKRRKEYVDRFTLFLKSGTLESRESDLLADVQRLNTMQAHAKELGPRVTKKLKFNRDINDLQENARILFKAMESLSTCRDHSCHCVCLELDSCVDHGAATTTKMHVQSHVLSFTVALASKTDAQEWHRLSVEAEVDDEPSPREVRKARFEKPAFSAPWEAIDHGLCNAIHPDVAFGISSAGRLKTRPSGPDNGCTIITSAKPVSVKALLEDSAGNEVLSFSDALQLALTITSTFLQLYSTGWVKTSLSTNEIVLLRPANGKAVIPLYILSLFDQTTGNPKEDHAQSNDSAKLLALAAMILELGLGRRLEDLKGRRDGHGREGTYHTIVRWLSLTGRDTLYDAPTCFREAIQFCLEKYREDLVLKNDVKQQEIADSLVYPFLRDLKHSRATL